MKLFLIKIGKAAKTIQREGILVGGRRVLKAFFSLFRKVGSGDILFITGGVGDSALYRTVHHSEELKFNGFKCSVTVQDNPFLPTYASKFKIFIFHRTLYSSFVKKLIEKIKKEKKEMLFGTDDLVFDNKYLEHMDYLKNINALEKKLYENGVGKEILDDPYVKACTTTTTFLADKLREHDKKVFIVPNKLSKKDVEVCEEILKNKFPSPPAPLPKGEGGIVRLGYFSGTISHNKDFATITDALMNILEKFSNVELFLAGPLDVENKLNRFGNRIKQFSYVPREKHFENISKVDINLSPLEIGNPFCEAKSELKFFEAGILGIPTVASATRTFKEAISDGVDGFVAENTQEWIEKLEKLILGPELRSRMGLEARKKTLEKYTTQNANNEQYYSYLRSRM